MARALEGSLRSDLSRCALLWCSAMLTGHASSNVPHHPVDLQWFRDELEPLAGMSVDPRNTPGTNG